ncbi:SDR family NAD(P)-dependent oxidoreductase [Paenarthrobacter aurescens]|uniref:SDR family NAD(P)-dependent oxidoreductase n=1 Tax=Paenarthrobacter aurescens TaxID=43663 RepID=UPI0035EB67FD
MSFSIEGKRMLVTGGARGIGGVSARYLASQGAHVVTCDIRDEEGIQLAKEATEAGPGWITYRHMDVTKKDEVDAAVEFAVGELGGLDAVFNIAGKPAFSSAEDATEAFWDEQFDIHAKGTAFVCQAAFPHMKERGGSIVNVAAGGALKSEPVGLSAYSASKGAVISYTRSIGLEWAPYRIRCNSVNPVVHTPGADEIDTKTTPELREAFHRQVHDKVPLGGKLGDVETDLAPVFQFLASDASKFITSQIIAVDGGLLPLR